MGKELLRGVELRLYPFGLAVEGARWSIFPGESCFPCLARGPDIN